MKNRRKLLLWSLPLVGMVLLVAWLLPSLRFPRRLPAVPADQTTRAEIPGVPHVRYWISEDASSFVEDVLAARERERGAHAAAGQTGDLPPIDILAVSGGGDNGAFGAGLLCGWTDSGTRPQFKLVTGVSTGALIAPFAFLGPDYDHVLRTVYTGVAQKDIARSRSFVAAVADDGMADNRPLWNLISRFVDKGFLARIAAEHAKGRLLLVATTDLDIREPVIWNMGAIAAVGSPKALELFRRILLASAAIPGAFPPTMVQVEVDGKAYEEMHVDGGTSAQVFLYPAGTRKVAEKMGVTMTRAGRVYVIRNSLFGNHWTRVDRRTLTIAGRAISSLIHSQGIGDLYRIFLQTRHDGLEFNLAYIDPGFNTVHVEDFDPGYMKSLFEYGYGQARNGYPWKHSPPGFTATSKADETIETPASEE